MCIKRGVSAEELAAELESVILTTNRMGSDVTKELIQTVAAGLAKRKMGRVITKQPQRHCRASNTSSHLHTRPTGMGQRPAGGGGAPQRGLTRRSTPVAPKFDKHSKAKMASYAAGGGGGAGSFESAFGVKIAHVTVWMHTKHTAAHTHTHRHTPL